MAENDDVIITATIFPCMEEVKKLLGENPDDDAIQNLLEEEVSKVNKKKAFMFW